MIYHFYDRGEDDREEIALPTGTYVGTIHGPLWLRILGRVWAGKTFSGSTVTNKVLGRQMFPGQVATLGQTVLIHYPYLHLTDHLLDVFGDGERWVGTLLVWRWTVRFTLSRP